MPKIVAHKNDWIRLGFHLFAEEGIKGIVVETIAKKLKCNKSSFYWHFNTKKAFVDELVAYWIAKETLSIIEEVNEKTNTKEKYDNFLRAVFRQTEDLGFIFFLKRYAKKRKDIQSIIDGIDEKRQEYTAELFQEMGCTKKEARLKATIFYKYMIGYHEMHRNKKQISNYLKEVKIDLKLLLNL